MIGTLRGLLVLCLVMPSSGVAAQSPFSFPHATNATQRCAAADPMTAACARLGVATIDVGLRTSPLAPLLPAVSEASDDARSRHMLVGLLIGVTAGALVAYTHPSGCAGNGAGMCGLGFQMELGVDVLGGGLLGVVGGYLWPTS